MSSTSLRFSVAALAWSFGLFAVVRWSWFDQYLTQSLAQLQWAIAVWYGAPSMAPVAVDGSCSGVDVVALCVGICLSYPTPWRWRLAGALGGTALVIALNTVRIGTLLASAEMPGLFSALHSYVWPAVVVVTVSGYMLAWMFVVTRRRRAAADAMLVSQPTFWRIAISCMALMLVYACAAPWTMTSETVLQAAEWTTAAGGTALSLTGVSVSVAGNVLITDRGAFQVTQECLLTPLLPLYIATVVALPVPWRNRILALALAIPIFFALGIARLLVLALPSAITGSPLVAAHAFYQIVAGVVALAGACLWAQHRVNSRWFSGNAALRFVMVSCAVALIVAAAGDTWRSVVAAASDVLAPGYPEQSHGVVDMQGALALLPGYQLALLTGLWLAVAPHRLGRYAMAIVLLACFQIALMVGVAELAARGSISLHPLALRALALGIPLCLCWMFVETHQPSAVTSVGSYRRFWERVGEDFPDLNGAASTALYFADERSLLSTHLQLDGCRLLKTDLWDEAKNTRILQWATDQGARSTGIDLSYPIVREARRRFQQRRLESCVADVRTLPFCDASFDAIYSMGTIEHFSRSADAVVELARVLKPGGRLILGVPNRYDPFLRPLMVAALSHLGLYAYGFEKSFSRRELRAMLEHAGLHVVAETGILFVPGWLRIVDLVCHTRGWTRSARLTAAAVSAVGRLRARYPSLKRHGYLLASVAVRRSDPPGLIDRPCRAR